jgi:hypothetical protein
MRIDVTLDVSLKGVDLVANTAFLTLHGKMGYEDNLLGIRRFDAYAFRVESGDPESTVVTLKRVLATQAIFYNRNKHNYFLTCRWNGGDIREGVSPGDHDRQLAVQAAAGLRRGAEKDFDGEDVENRVILKKIPVFRTEVLVEDLDPSAKEKISRKLETELSTAPVVVTTLGTCWHLAVRAQSLKDARAVTEGIVVTEKRDSGLLLNPNYQGFRFLGGGRMDVTE